MPETGITTIRPAEAEDAHIFPAIENSAGTLFEDIAELAWIAGAEDLPVDRYREIIAQGFSWSAVDSSDQCVGFLCGGLESDELHIWEIAVLRHHQRDGIGRALLETAIRMALDRGLSAVTLTTFRDVPWNASYYLGFGFSIVEPNDMSDRLRSLLEQEKLRGLPPELRCAMRLPVASTTLT